MLNYMMADIKWIMHKKSTYFIVIFFMVFHVLANHITHSANIRSLGSVKYIVIHYTGNKGDTARANCNYFRCSNTGYAGVCCIDYVRH